MRSPTLRRPALPRLLALVLPLALGPLALACDGAADPLAPDTDAVAGLVASTADSAGPAAALAAGTAPRIVFTSTRKGGYDVFKMDPQGNNVAPLVASTVFEFMPAWSRDNARIAVSRQRSNGTYVHDDIWVVNADGSNGHWARSTPTQYDLMFPSWSPDGKRIVVTVSVGGALCVGWVTPATGALNVYMTGTSYLQGQNASYTPNGQIVYLGPTGKSIIRMNADGSNPKTLVSSTTLLRDPAVSPDGTRLAYAKAGTTSFDIQVKTLATGTIKTLAPSAATFEGQPTWSPDGTRIAFTSNRSGGQPQIWTMTAAGGSLLQITHTATTERDPAWSH